MSQNSQPASFLKLSNRSAFEEIFRLYYKELCSYACFYLKDMDAAEEVVQDIFVSLWEGREKLNISPSVKAYLYRSVRNRCLNIFKHEEVREKHRQEEKLRLVRQTEDYDSYAEAELQQRIEQAVEKLPTERKKIFALSRYEDLKYKEIAEQLGISIKTVENQMGKALKFLKEQLADYLPLLLLVLNWLIKKS